eukprot:CAMPEP_0178373542 /NCGR_PEP_ID=MMETSP0689_2-20121128/1915_1 /TAXON_ID=160604 /ORGANISM="Amphidinium massartii, Strain CS-259" /LENGTH=385 /DNA_ID=CAMNT_0019993485 /DNA_START=33 /DNA_END=1186 /DNA_ORIENTATION=-
MIAAVSRCIFSLLALDSVVRTEAAVPRFIWSYWHNHSELPKSVLLATKSWAKYAPDFEVRLLSQETWQTYLDDEELHSKLAHLDSKKFADYLRVSVLARYGGVWMDATILLFEPLGTLIDEDARMSGVRYASNFEPYFIAAPAGSELMKSWRDELVKVLAMSKDEFERHLIQIRWAGIEPLNGGYKGCSYRYEFQEVLLHLLVRVVNNVISWSPWGSEYYIFPCGEQFWVHYLIVLVALNTALRADGLTGDADTWWRKRGIATQEATATVLAVANSQDFRDASTAEFLMTRRSAGVSFAETPGLKLRASERNFMEAWTHCEAGSLICRLQLQVGEEIFPSRNSSGFGLDGLQQQGTGKLPKPLCGDSCKPPTSFGFWDASLAMTA